MVLDMSAADVLTKVAMFVLIQALVYLILSNSSDVFSKTKIRSLSFKPARSASIRRMLAVLSDMPEGDEASPLPRGLQSPTTQEYPATDDYKSY